MLRIWTKLLSWWKVTELHDFLTTALNAVEQKGSEDMLMIRVEKGKREVDTKHTEKSIYLAWLDKKEEDMATIWTRTPKSLKLFR